MISIQVVKEQCIKDYQGTYFRKMKIMMEKKETVRKKQTKI